MQKHVPFIRKLQTEFYILEEIFNYSIIVTKIAVVIVILETITELQKELLKIQIKQSSIFQEVIISKLNRLKHSKLHLFLEIKNNVA